MPSGEKVSKTFQKLYVLLYLFSLGFIASSFTTAHQVLANQGYYDKNITSPAF